MDLDEPSHHGWNNNCQPIWAVNPFPDNLSEMFLDDKTNDKLEFLSDDSSCD